MIWIHSTEESSFIYKQTRGNESCCESSRESSVVSSEATSYNNIEEPSMHKLGDHFNNGDKNEVRIDFAEGLMDFETIRLYRYKISLYLGFLETHSHTLVFVSNKLISSVYKSNVLFVQVKCPLCTSQMSSLHKSNVIFVHVKCCFCTSRMLSLYKSNVAFVQVKCHLCTSQMASLYKINLQLI